MGTRESLRKVFETVRKTVVDPQPSQTKTTDGFPWRTFVASGLLFVAAYALTAVISLCSFWGCLHPAVHAFDYIFWVLLLSFVFVHRWFVRPKIRGPVGFASDKRPDGLVARAVAEVRRFADEQKRIAGGKSGLAKGRVYAFYVDAASFAGFVWLIVWTSMPPTGGSLLGPFGQAAPWTFLQLPAVAGFAALSLLFFVLARRNHRRMRVAPSLFPAPAAPTPAPETPVVTATRVLAYSGVRVPTSARPARYCSACGHELRAGEQFCPDCSQKIPVAVEA